MLTKQHVEQFLRDGFVVVEDVLSEKEVFAARESFHADLQNSFGINHDAIINRHVEPHPECGIKSPVSELYYMRWKLRDIHLHENVVNTMHDLLSATFLNPDLISTFPRPSPLLSDDVFAYIDRVCYRLPNIIRNEKGLGLHLDRHPTMPFAHIKKWRPIQAFVTLTDHWGGATGGLQVVPGFHTNYDFFNQHDVKESAGEFFRMNDHAYDKIRKKAYYHASSKRIFGLLG